MLNSKFLYVQKKIKLKNKLYLIPTSHIQEDYNQLKKRKKHKNENIKFNYRKYSFYTLFV